MVFMDTATGALLSSHALPAALHRLSLRHMAVDAGGEVWIGGQYEGDVFDNVPVLAKLHEDRGLVSVELEDRAAGALGKYAGSVAIGNHGVTLAVASPKSGVVVTLDTLTGKALEIDMKPGTCGASGPARWLCQLQ
jgi:hypothetical protein